MADHIYYCGECRDMFEVEVERPDEGVPSTATCPSCGSENAMRAFPFPTGDTAGGCAPGSGC